jgi:crotonobetainyl-CoA:carnitine CoA-transferase CaiB-like acyl-CoA transferase
MLVQVERTDGVEQPVLVAGNPIKMSRVAEGPERNVPLMGEHTESVLSSLLGLDRATIEELMTEGVVGRAKGSDRPEPADSPGSVG